MWEHKHIGIHHGFSSAVHENNGLNVTNISSAAAMTFNPAECLEKGERKTALVILSFGGVEAADNTSPIPLV